MKAHSDPQESLLIRMAESISDGAPIDWADETSRRVVPGAKLGSLRLVEAIVKAHRALPLTGLNPAGLEQPSRSEGIDSSDITSWGHLTNLRLIKRGAFGEVFRAFDPRLEREVALKLPRPEKMGHGAPATDFLREARLLARVKHPNVMVVHGADEFDGRAGLWTDLIEGRTLEECLKQQGPFAAPEAALIGIQLCGALAAVHAAGLVHRDLKSSNVMRDKGGQILLMDFGTASRAATRAKTDERFERAGTLITMAPEILLHGQAARPQADIYGLGVLLYQLVSGRYPIEAESCADLVEKHRLGRMLPLRDARPDLPAAFVQVVERALSADPESRYPTAGAMEQALAATLPRPARRRGWLALTAAAAAVLALVLAVWWWGPRSLQVEASFFRVAAGQLEPIDSGARVKPGDHLGLEILGSEPHYSYVLNEDEKGEMWVLFPAGLDLANPLPPRSRVRLPGRLAGEQIDWVVTTAHGTETIVAIVSREPLPEIEAVIARTPRVSAGGQPTYPSIDADAVGRLFRGIGAMAPSPAAPQTGAPGRLKELIQRLPREAGIARGVWMRQIELENPGP